jgi:hypothetical protein
VQLEQRQLLHHGQVDRRVAAERAEEQLLGLLEQVHRPQRYRHRHARREVVVGT